MAKQDNSLIPAERIERAIILIRDEKVMLDSDLATLYGVETKELVRAVGRNRERFPKDFAYQLTQQEFTALRCQIGTSNVGRGGRRTCPWVFTEQGIAMLSSVLHSKRAIEVNIEIMRAFVRLRQMISSHADLARQLNELEQKYDQQFAVVFEAIRKLMERPKELKPREMGYHTLMPKRNARARTNSVRMPSRALS